MLKEHIIRTCSQWYIMHLLEYIDILLCFEVDEIHVGQLSLKAWIKLLMELFAYIFILVHDNIESELKV